ncbi:MAG: S8 family serine peptidase [Bdellovibrionaceae bacterium]|nr:S8 family serine peptidase [Pseudobdellovibrionaceae bacterium]
MRGWGLVIFGIFLGSTQISFAEQNLCELRPSSLNIQSVLTVAIIDTGLDTQIPFFRDHLWTNPGETGLDSQGRDKRTNGIDDDGNGYIDDVHGWNFAGQNNDLGDEVGHGTHVAGLIVSGGKEVLSPSPLAINVRTRVMVLKYHDGRNIQGRGRAFQKALEYAARENANVIHISGGGYQSLPQEKRLFRQLAEKGIPVVVASGNKQADRPHAPFYPSAYGFTNLISVSAVDNGGRLLPTTNESPGGLFLHERGADLASLLPGSRIGRMTGTSQAAALLCGRMIHLWETGCRSSVLK